MTKFFLLIKSKYINTIITINKIRFYDFSPPPPNRTITSTASCFFLELFDVLLKFVDNLSDDIDYRGKSMIAVNRTLHDV